MIFTDEHLAKLKSTSTFSWHVGWDEIMALVARLEAAERVCFYLERWLVTANPNTDVGLSLAEWNKARGKASGKVTEED